MSNLPEPFAGPIRNAAYPTPGQGLVLDAIGQLPLAVRQTLPGYEIAYDQITSPVNVVSTTEGTPTSIIPGTSKTYENVPYMFHFNSPHVDTPSVAGGFVAVLLMEDGVSIGRIALVTTSAALSVGEGTSIPFRFTPTAGAHTFGISAFASSTTGTPDVGAGAGGAAGTYAPSFLRVTRV